MNIGITDSKKSIVIFFKQDITKLFMLDHYFPMR